jgi:dephospho-CoA kinase
MKKIGLTGGAGAGKSTVAQILKKKGISIFDLDEIGKDLVKSTPFLQSQLNAIAKLPPLASRHELRDRVFHNPDIRIAIEKILHPMICQRFEAELQDLSEPLAVCEAALLIETGYHVNLDSLIVVSANEKVRMERLLQREGMTRELIQNIFKAQISEMERLKYADHVIHNEGDVEELEKQTFKILKKIGV